MGHVVKCIFGVFPLPLVEQPAIPLLFPVSTGALGHRRGAVPCNRSDKWLLSLCSELEAVLWSLDTSGVLCS